MEHMDSSTSPAVPPLITELSKHPEHFDKLIALREQAAAIATGLLADDARREAASFQDELRTIYGKPVRLKDAVLARLHFRARAVQREFPVSQVEIQPHESADAECPVLKP